MKITLINPNIITQKGDFFGTGIPFLPITLAYTAAYLRDKGHKSAVIDAFGEDPKRITSQKDFFVQGLSLEEIMARIPQDTEAIILYASLVITHNANLKIIKAIREKFAVPIIVLENIHSVVGYSLLKVHQDFLDLGADFIILGDPEKRCLEIINSIKKKKQPKIDGIIFKSNGKTIIKPLQTYPKDLDKIPFPAWDMFPIKNYWSLCYSHAPIKKSYLPLLTSRGCPYHCEFCITPQLLGSLWRPRSAKNVVEEIEHYIKQFNVREFHIEDLNPTVSKQRIFQLCQEIIDRKLKIELKIVAGTKAETIDRQTISWMKNAGFSYISISPESGSKRMLQKMNKNFDYQHGLEIIKHMHDIGITSQACFVIGFPGEEKRDLKLTREYIKRLVKAGIDEIALFVMTPIPGSKASEYSPLGYKDLSQLTFSPRWRKTYHSLSQYRTRTYLFFLIWKLRYHPLKLFKNIYNVATKKFNTKMEMALWRVIRTNIKGIMRRRL